MIRIAWVASALFVLADSCQAGNYRIWFQGTEEQALKSAAGSHVAPYVTPAPPAAANSSRDYGAGTPNQIVTFLHPYTNKAITVPLTLPVGRPNVITRSDRIIFDYGLFSHKVVVRFLPNGLVEVRYRG